VPSTPPRPADETSRRLAELDRFFTDQADVLEYFVPEAVEHLESMAQSLIALEGEGATESEIAALFRAVHTLKGAAYTVGCGMIGDLAHRVEDMLGEIREHQRPLDRAAIETVFASLDALRLLVRSGEDRAETRAGAYQRATGLLDSLPTIGAGTTLEPQPGIESVAQQTADDTAAVSRVATSQASVAEAPQRLDPAVAVERVAHAPEQVARGPERGRSAREAAARRVRPSIRVSLNRLDAVMNLVGELVITRSRLERHLGQLEQAGELLSFTQSRMTQTVAEFESKYADRLVPPVRRLFAPFARMVRDGSRAAGKSVVLEVRGETVEMDTTIVELMADPLIHLVRNAIAHGIEPEELRHRTGKPPQGTIHLGAAHKGGSIYIEVADDGRGID